MIDFNFYKNVVKNTVNLIKDVFFFNPNQAYLIKKIVIVKILLHKSKMCQFFRINLTKILT